MSWQSPRHRLCGSNCAHVSPALGRVQIEGISPGQPDPNFCPTRKAFDLYLLSKGTQRQHPVRPLACQKEKNMKFCAVIEAINFTSDHPPPAAKLLLCVRWNAAGWPSYQLQNADSAKSMLASVPLSMATRTSTLHAISNLLYLNAPATLIKRK